MMADGHGNQRSNSQALPISDSAYAPFKINLHAAALARHCRRAIFWVEFMIPDSCQAGAALACLLSFPARVGAPGDFFNIFHPENPRK